MEKRQLLGNDIDWRDLIRHVFHDRVVVELSEGELPVALLVPIERPKSMANLDKALRSTPRLADELSSFESDIIDGKASLNELDDPWES